LPPSLYHLVRGSVDALTGQVVDLACFSSSSSLAGVADALHAAPRSVGAKVAVVERGLRRLLKDLPHDAPDFVRASARGFTALDRRLQESRYSERQIRRDFTRYVGISPKRYRDMVRIEAVCARLTHSRHVSLADLAHTFEFYDQAHFNKTFKRYAGMSPAAFERRLRLGPVGTFERDDSGAE
jgi:AraC-like DNA-binding protein